jgi:hypothetical protein
MATRKRTKGQTTDTFTKAYILFMSAAGKNKNQIIQNKRHTDSTKNPWKLRDFLSQLLVDIVQRQDLHYTPTL